jgi:hypothetical protein
LRGEVLRNSLEAVSVGLEVPKGHTIGPGLDELVSGFVTRQTYSCREDSIIFKNLLVQQM